MVSIRKVLDMKKDKNCSINILKAQFNITDYFIFNFFLAQDLLNITWFAGIFRIFAEHRPTNIQFIDDFSCTVRWTDAEDAARVFLYKYCYV